MSHHSKDHKLLQEAYEQVTPGPTSPVPEKPVMETPPTPTPNDNRKFYKVAVDVIYHCTEEDLADTIRGDVLQVMQEDPVDFAQEVPATDPAVIEGLKDGMIDP